MSVIYVKHNLKLRIPAGKAAPGASINQTLGQYGIKIPDFCKEFNEQTKNIKEGVVVGVKFQVLSNRSYKFEIKRPSSTDMLKQVFNTLKPTLETLNEKEREDLLLKEYYQIARLMNYKKNNVSEELALKNTIKTIKSTAKSFGITKK